MVVPMDQQIDVLSRLLCEQMMLPNYKVRDGGGVVS